MLHLAFEQLFKERYNSLYSYSMLFVNDSEECRDLVSDAFAILWKKHREVPPEQWTSLLYTIVHDRCVDLIRHKGTVDRYLNFCQSVGARMMVADPREIDLREERISEIEGMIERLPERTRYVLRQCYYEHRSYADVAQELGISVNGIKKHIMKALGYLRQNINLNN